MRCVLTHCTSQTLLGSSRALLKQQARSLVSCRNFSAHSLGCSLNLHAAETGDMETAETLIQRAAEMVTALGDATNNAASSHVEARTAFWMARLDVVGVTHRLRLCSTELTLSLTLQACVQGREPVASYAFKMLNGE